MGMTEHVKMADVASKPIAASRIPGFYKRTLDERRQILSERFGLSNDDLSCFSVLGGLQAETADHMVENGLGILGLPVGIALNFVINDEPTLVPMAVEEPSVIAACSHIAALVAESGGFAVETDPPVIVGQVQILHMKDLDEAMAAVMAGREDLIQEANRLCPGLVARGGGCLDIEVRHLPQITEGPDAHLDGGGSMLVVHVLVDCQDAMGANMVNTIVEGLAPQLETLTKGEARLRILSNLADRRRARAKMKINYSDLARKAAKEKQYEEGRLTALRIVDAYRFAARDPYRACTHNKGIMNGVDAVAIATGNDWRALEAGAHAYAARNGRYTSLTRYWTDDNSGCLHGEIEMPMAVGTVGGATRVHPTIGVCRKLLGTFSTNARSLAGVMAATGLSQNCGALKALATEGIQRGHMALHARQVALAAGATEKEVPVVAQELIQNKTIGARQAEEILARIRPNSPVGEEGRA
jgi:hydroxymethylglutaryl-CoA reductase